jgi:hypothetical protein
LQEQVYVFGGGGGEGCRGDVEAASADPESASIAAMAAEQAILTRRRCF